jgi:hypothetical protein
VQRWSCSGYEAEVILFDMRESKQNKFFWLCTFFEQHCGGCEYIHDLGEKEMGEGLIIVLISSNWSGLRCGCVRNCVVHESWVIAVVRVAGNHGAWKQDSLFEGNWCQDRKHMWFQLVGYVRPIGSKADGMQTPEQIIEHQKGQGQVAVQLCQRELSPGFCWECARFQ